MKKFLSAAAVLAIASGANAAVIYSTSFEAPTFSAGANPTVGQALNGQGGWQADAGNVIGNAAAAHSGSQYANMTSAQLGTTARWAWEATTTSRTAAQLAAAPIIRASVWTSMVGTAGARVVTAGLDLYNIGATERIGLMYIASDGSVNVLDGNGLGGGTAAGSVNINTWHQLTVEANFATNSVEFFIDGISIYVGGHVSTDFGDADIRGTRGTSGTGGPTSVKFDDYVIEQNAVPAPGALALVGLGGLVATRRRRA